MSGEDLVTSRAPRVQQEQRVQQAQRTQRVPDVRAQVRAARLADAIARSLAPRTVFDAGCGVPGLVAALWDCGIEAHGRAASEAVLDSAVGDARGSFAVGPLSAPIEGRYDLVVCLGASTTLGGLDARGALEAVTAVTDRVLFSLGPPNRPGELAATDHERALPEPLLAWLRPFAALGFAPVLAHDASYAGAGGVLLERSRDPVRDDVLSGAVELSSLRRRMTEAQARSGWDASGEGSSALLAMRDLEGRFTSLAREIVNSRLELDRVRAELAASRHEIQALEGTRTLRYTKRARTVYARLRAPQPARAPSQPAVPLMPPDPLYDLWRAQFDDVDDERRARLVGRLAALEHAPLISVVMPVHDTPARYLREAIDSVRSQIYENWELCCVDDCSTAPWVAEILGEYQALDDRIRVLRREENGHISAASNTGLEAARGEWVALLDHDDTLAEHALALAVLALAEHPDAGLLYSDEDKFDDTGARSVECFKSEFDPLLLLAENYVCHMTMVRRDLAQSVGGFREGFEGSQDWDLVLRVTEHLDVSQVVHVPHVLYHWRVHAGSTAAARSAKPYATRAGARAVADHLARLGELGEVLVSDATGLVRVRWALPEEKPLVSVIVPTRDGEYLGRCLGSLFSCTDYPSFEVVIVDNGSVKDETMALFEGYGVAAKVVHDPRPFNFAQLVNSAIAHCSGEVLCLLNDDCELTDPGWLTELVSQLMREGVGIAGAKLLYPDGRVQHAGVVLGVNGVAGHVHRLSDRLDPGHFGWLQTARQLSAVTGACMVVRRCVFDALGGFDEVNLGIAFNDIDFCLRAREAGWSVVWTPHATLLHRESMTRGHDPSIRPASFRDEVSYMQQRWHGALRSDPAYNPNLTVVAEDFSLAFPPRVLWWAP